MGSICNYASLERYLNKNEEKLKEKYSELLIGKVVEKVSDTFVEYHIKNFITLDDGEQYETHFRWSTEEEQYIETEIVNEDDEKMENYFNTYIINRKIIEVNIGFDKDDYIYAYAKTDKEGIIEIPIKSVYELE